ncbi:MAG TPA: hypothetical protein VF032_06435 [Thermoleophilaceae bacterium]
MERRVAPLAVALAIAIVAVSLVFDRVVQFDPQGWLLWGREVTSSGAAFSTLTYPSWKPLPFLFAVPLSLTGGAAPVLWLAIERLAALTGVGLAYVLARRMAGHAAGAIAAAALVLSPGWITLAIDGRSEPLTIAIVLGALLLHRSGRRRAVVALLALAALDRPEALAPAVLYAAIYTPRTRTDLGFAAAALAAVPILWLGGDWLGSGDPFHGAKLARATGQRLPLASVISLPLRAWVAQVSVPLAAGAVAGTALAVARRDRLVLSLAGFAGAWLAASSFLLLRGYPHLQLPRFLLPAAAAGVVLGAIGLVQMVSAVGKRPLRRAAAAATAVVLVLFAGQGVPALSAGVGHAAWYARNVSALDDALADAGGGRRLLGCGHVAVDAWAAPQVAWDLGISPDRVGTPRAPGLIVARAGLPYPGLAKLVHLRRLATLGPWRFLYAGSPSRGCALFSRT